MEIDVSPDYEELSRRAAQDIFETVSSRPRGLFCFAAGDTPRRAYEIFAGLARRSGLDLSACAFVGLDEWIGLSRSEAGSCRAFLDGTIFGPLGIEDARVCFFDGRAAVPSAECERVSRFIQARGPIDLVVLGIGMNGHLGFNEPGSAVDSGCRTIELETVTQVVGKKYFVGHDAPLRGYTIGLAQILRAKRAILLSSGASKAGITAKALDGIATPELPASLLGRHGNAKAYLDAGSSSSMARLRA